MADNFSGAAAGGGASDWEVVSLTASAYAAAPGPVLPHLLDAHNKTGFPSAAIFMSQHFNLAAAEELSTTDLNGGRQEQDGSNPAAMVDDDEAVDTDDDLNKPSPEARCETEMQGDDGLTRSSDSRKNLSSTTALALDDGNALLQLQAGAISVRLPGEEEEEEEEERQATIVGFHNATQPDAAAASHTTASVHHHVSAGSDSIVTVVDYASLAADRVVPAANKKGPSSSSKIPCEARAWWNKTFRFLRNNSKESLTFRFIFVAATIVGLAVLGQRDKLQLRLELNVDTEKISCAVREPLGQVKLNMLVGGSPVAQGYLS